MLRARLDLGWRLEALRTKAGITGQRAGAAIGASGSKISRIESGQVPVRARDARALLRLYRAPEQDCRELTGLAEQGRQPGWWDQYVAVLSGSVRYRLSLEAAASRISIWDPLGVPALLQEPAYAAAIADSQDGQALLLDQLGPGVLARRQALLMSGHAPRVWAVISEAALMRAPAGDPRILAGQLAHLSAMSRRGVVSVQVMPLRHHCHLLSPGAFDIVRFDDAATPYRPGPPDAVIAGHLDGSAVFRQRQHHDRYWHAFMRATVASWTPAQTAQLIGAAYEGGWPPPG